MKAVTDATLKSSADSYAGHVGPIDLGHRGAVADADPDRLLDLDPEAGDVSAGVFDAEGRMLAQAVTGTPGHVNAMARAVRHFLAQFPIGTMQDGDVFFTNDPEAPAIRTTSRS